MVKLIDVFHLLEESYPCHLAESIDNVGLLVGNTDAPVNKVLCCLDVVHDVVDYAISIGADLIVSHHPIMWNGVKKITSLSAEGRLLMKLIKNDIGVISMHTNMDRALGGLNDGIAQLLNLSNVEIYQNDLEKYGLFRIGEIAPMTMEQLATHVAKTFRLKTIRYTSRQADEKITKVAISSGGGGSNLDYACQADCQVFISGDLKYNQLLDAPINIIDLPHYNSEFYGASMICRLLTESFGNQLQCSVCDRNKDIINIVQL